MLLQVKPCLGVTAAYLRGVGVVGPKVGRGCTVPLRDCLGAVKGLIRLGLGWPAGRLGCDRCMLRYAVPYTYCALVPLGGQQPRGRGRR